MEQKSNTLKETEEAAPVAEEPVAKPSKKKENRFWAILKGSFLSRESVIKQLPFLVVLTMIGVVYIFNSNYSDKTVIRISRTKKELEELRFNYINTKSKLMQASRQSELVHRLEQRGIKESKVPPRKIILEQKNND